MMNKVHFTNNKNLKLDTLVADPPWNIQQLGRYGAQGHYDLMTMPDIIDMGEAIQALTADNAHLYLWVTNAVVPYIKEILEGWGFTYRSIVTWVKPRLGLGGYFRNSTEQLIFATRGKAPVAFKGQPTWFFAPVQDHSHKPEEFYEIVERMSGSLGNGVKGELFARRKHHDWLVWGNEIDSDFSLKDFGYPVPSDPKFEDVNITESDSHEEGSK
jgi:N6-adenosine-specific RNA methylase IME4